MACAALRARSMIFSSAERVMFIADPLTQHILCAHMSCVKVGGQQNRPLAVSHLPGLAGGLSRAHHARASRRVEFHITAHLQQVGIPVHKNCLKTALEQVSHLAVAAVECLRNHTVEVAHHPRQVRAARVQDDVIVIAPQAIGQHLRVKAMHALQHAEQRSPVAVVLENWLALVAAGGDVVARPRELDVQGSGHGAKDCGGGGKWQELTPD